MLVNLGVNHKHVPVDLLGSLTLAEPGGFYRFLRQIPGVAGCIVLQTCNRVEFYLDTEQPDIAIEGLLRQWALESKFKLSELSKIVERKDADAIVEHLVRISSGLESMLVGEPQILGQLRDALTEAGNRNAVSPMLSELFQKAIHAGSQIRQHTGIGKGSVSLGSAALKIAEETLGPIRKCRVLILGTGQVGMLMMKALKARQVDNILVAGRTRQGALSFCRTHGGTPIDFGKLGSYLSSIDLLLVATKATKYLVTREILNDALKNRHDLKLMIIDLSTPRNVSPNVKRIQGVTLKSLGDVREIASETLARRREIVKHAEPLVKERTEEISALLRREEAEPIVAELYRRAERIRIEEVQKALSRVKLEPDERKSVEAMSISLVEKILGLPAVNLRKAAERGDNQLLSIAANVFRGE